MVSGNKIAAVGSGDFRKRFNRLVQIDCHTVIEVPADKNDVRAQILYLGGDMPGKSVISYLAQMSVAHPDRGFPFPWTGQKRKLNADSGNTGRSCVDESIEAREQGDPDQNLDQYFSVQREVEPSGQTV